MPTACVTQNNDFPKNRAMRINMNEEEKKKKERKESFQKNFFTRSYRGINQRKA